MELIHADQRMTFRTLLVDDAEDMVTVTFNRPEARNSVDHELLRELNALLDLLDGRADRAPLVLQGQRGSFCSGMDFEGLAALDPDALPADRERIARPYMQTLRRMSTMARVVIAKVDGEALAGGIGFVAASDLAVATPGSRFSLSEVLWGLLPAMVVPYLIRRVGYQNAYRMALTSAPVSAAAAERMGLVDEVADDPSATVRRLVGRVSRVQPATVGDLKRYFRRMWLLTDAVEDAAVVSELHGVADAREDQHFLLQRPTPPGDVAQVRAGDERRREGEQAVVRAVEADD